MPLATTQNDNKPRGLLTTLHPTGKGKTMGIAVYPEA